MSGRVFAHHNKSKRLRYKSFAAATVSLQGPAALSVAQKNDLGSPDNGSLQFSYIKGKMKREKKAPAGEVHLLYSGHASQGLL